MPTLIFQGTPYQIKSQLLEFRNQYLLLQSKDIGQFVGEPVGDYLRRKPIPLSLTIHFRGIPKPLRRGRKPKGTHTENTNTTKEDPSKRVQVKILCPKKELVDWNVVKAIAGGANGYLWGRWYGRAKILLDEGIGSVECWGGTKNEAEKQLLMFASLSEGKLLTYSVKEEKIGGVRIRGEKLYKESIRIYPHYFTVINQQQFISNIERDRGRQYIDGKKYLVKQAKIPLWHDKEPSFAKDKIRELLRRGE